MRLRKLHNANEILNDSRYYLKNPIDIKKNWNSVFNNNPIELEIGCGKGQFIINKAITFSNINFIGIEINETICAKAIKKINQKEVFLNNLLILNYDARKLSDIFLSNTIDNIYLNFSDPWPKKRHEKKRLTNNQFLDIYKNLLKKNGCIFLKTDNDNFFEYTCITLKSRSDIKILYESTDIYSDKNHSYNKNDIATEYENKFIATGKNINKVIFCFK